MALLTTGVGGALVSLGVFLGIGGYVDGERRIWALVAFGALGLLVLAVGAGVLVGAALMLRQSLTGLRTYTLGVTEPGLIGEAITRATARLSGRRLISAEGQTTTTLPLAGGGPRTRPSMVSPAQAQLARQLALLHRHGLLDLWRIRVLRWSWARPEGPSAGPGGSQEAWSELRARRRAVTPGSYLPEDVQRAARQLHPLLVQAGDDSDEAGALPVAGLWRQACSDAALMQALTHQGMPPAASPFQRPADLLAGDEVEQALEAELATAGQP